MAPRTNQAEVPLTEEQRQLAAKWMGLVHKIVALHAQSAADRAELYSRLQLALLRAARTYQPEKGFTFQAYATRILSNAVIDERRATGRRREVLGLSDQYLEALSNRAHDPAKPPACDAASINPEPDDRQLPRQITPQELALDLLRQDATNREIIAATGLKVREITRLAKSARVVRIAARRSRLSRQLAMAHLPRKTLREATGMARSSITSRLRTVRWSNRHGTSRRNPHRRKYRAGAYVLGIMGTNRNRTPGRPLAVPERLWPELRRRQLEGAKLDELVKWLSQQGIVAGKSSVARCLERCAAVAPPAPTRAQRIMEAAEKMPPATDEEDVTNLRAQLRKDAFHGADWKERHSAARLLLQIIEARKTKSPPEQPQQPTATAAPMTREEEEAMIAEYERRAN